ncbi:MAG: HAD family hydrolase [Acidobacteriota bacterium]|nr:HAD family hydrolase [Acidobacteriota bacterium]
MDDPQAVIADKRAVYLERLAREGVPYRAGAVTLIERLAAKGVPLGLATGSDRRQLAAVLGPRRLERHFAALLTRDDVARGKPDPEIYLETAARLGRAPGRCVVIEDTHAGIAAARAAGMACIALTGTQPRDLLGEADRIVDHLDQVAALLAVS